MKSRHPKAVHRILGQPLVSFPAELCRLLGIERVLVVVPANDTSIRAVLGEGYEYVEQAEPLGSADALLTACRTLGDFDGPVLILAASQPLVSLESVRNLLSRHAETGAAALLTPGTTISPAPSGVLPCVFHAGRLRSALAQADAPGSELCDALELLVAEGAAIDVTAAAGAELSIEVADRADLAYAAAFMRSRICREHLLNGVTIEDPTNTYIEPGVTIGQDTVIRPQSFLAAGTVIGEECEIGPFVRIGNCRIGDRVVIQSAVLADSEVGDDTRIGPFAQLRPGCKVGRKVKIGNFVELKNTTAEDGASMGHFAYLGDAFVGEKSNIGAGTITCNYDGKKKHRTHIGRHTFVGTHATLVAPVQVGDGAFVAAGSVITEEVPADALAIGRGRQVNKPDWAKQRRERE
jgi:bifunctional UDP-N-acetylglucosamine pyrophosphorylase/glucosamine-1-phosphate N-acetyltransferase